MEEATSTLDRIIGQAQKARQELMFSIQAAHEAKLDLEKTKPRAREESHQKKASTARQEGHRIEIPEKSELEASLEDILKLVVSHNGSDLHLKAGTPPVIRIQGELVSVGTQILTPQDTKRLILGTMTSEMITSLYNRKEMDYSFESPCGRFRVNTFLQKFTVSAAFRLVKADVPSFEKLLLPPVLEEIANLNNGLFLVTGPAGMGKSTTLASLINHMSKTRKLHIITIEDPVEYLFEDNMSIITQREVGIDTESFEMAVRMALRQDPNVIMIGELRDQETVTQALMAAETGHLVLSTLHTPSAVQALQRLADFFPGTLQKQFLNSLSATLRGVLSQRLIKRKDKEERVPAVEMLIATPTISSLIKEGAIGEIYEYLSQGTIEGMCTFTQSLSRLMEEGLITKEEALYYAERPTELKLSLAGGKSDGNGSTAREKAPNWWHDRM